MIAPLFLSFVVSILIVTGQVLWKLEIGTSIINLDNLFKKIRSPLFIIGVIVYIFATVIWLYTMSKYNYHYIYPLMIGLSLILTLLASHFIFQETISWTSLLGVLVICFGIIMITTGSKIR